MRAIVSMVRPCPNHENRKRYVPGSRKRSNAKGETMPDEALQNLIDNADIDELVTWALERWNADEIAEKLMELSSLTDREKLRRWVAEQVVDAMG